MGISGALGLRYELIWTKTIYNSIVTYCMYMLRPKAVMNEYRAFIMPKFGNDDFKLCMDYRAGEKGPQGLVLSSVTYWARTAF